MARGHHGKGQRGQKSAGMSGQDAEAAINRKLIESGERERLRERLMEKLLESGWKERVKLQVVEYVNDKGLENARVEDIVQELAPRASSLVSDNIKRDLLEQVQDFLDKDAQY